jgi:hypothetical protein
MEFRPRGVLGLLRRACEGVAALDYVIEGNDEDPSEAAVLRESEPRRSSGDEQMRAAVLERRAVA